MNKKTLRNILFILLIAFLPLLIRELVNNSKEEVIVRSYELDEIKAIMEKRLYAKYGEKFVVDRLGTRTSRDTEFYQARIYPKSIIGTTKEEDSFYYGRVSVDILSCGGLSGVADTYGEIKMNKEAEEYLMPKIRQLFGERVLIKTNVAYKELKESGSFVQYLESGFLEKRDEVINNPGNRRLEVDLDIYVFKRIEDEEEKEERREEIFEFLQYLKEEGLFEYLELGVIFIDERVLAPSYGDFSREIARTPTVRVEIEGDIVRLPSLELRERMSRQLQNEIDAMSEEYLLANMRNIRKSDLNYDDLRKYNGQYHTWAYSFGMLEARYSSSITEEDKERNYDNIEDIQLNKYRSYMYINLLGR